jgi:hypothetical protein
MRIVEKRKMFGSAVLTESGFRYKSTRTLRTNAEDGNQTISPSRKTTRVKTRTAAAVVRAALVSRARSTLGIGY